MRKDFTLEGELMIEEGDIGNHMFFLRSGSVQIELLEKGVVGTKAAPCYFGELALFGFTVRTAGDKAATRHRHSTLRKPREMKTRTCVLVVYSSRDCRETVVPPPL